MSRPRSCFGALALTIALVGGACSDDDDSADTDATITSTAPAAEPDTVDVTAIDYAFEGLPEEVAAGSTISLRNDSDAEVHELVALRLGDDETRSLDELLALPQAELEALFTAPPALVLIAPPGEDGFNAVGSGALKDPGRYAVVCFIPTGADPQAFLDALEQNPGVPPDVPGGAPHFTSGMAQQVTVR